MTYKYPPQKRRKGGKRGSEGKRSDKGRNDQATRIKHRGNVRFTGIGNNAPRNDVLSTDQAAVSEENMAGSADRKVLIPRTVSGQSDWAASNLGVEIQPLVFFCVSPIPVLMAVHYVVLTGCGIISDIRGQFIP